MDWVEYVEEVFEVSEVTASFVAVESHEDEAWESPIFYAELGDEEVASKDTYEFIFTK